MALSIKAFDHATTCPEPDNSIVLNYHATSSDQLCAGNGTTYTLWNDNYASLADLYSNGAGVTGSNEDICAEGMDVVFVVDYTNSMSGAITGVKNGITQIVNTIDSESNGNYRLGLVLFDGAGSSSPLYSASGYYQGLPNSQKINSPGLPTGTNGGSGSYDFITCVEKMNLVGNSTTFSQNLAAIDQPNGPSGMSLGSSVECGGRAIAECASNGFAGQWRSGVQKLIILITDDQSENNSTYFNQSVIAPCDQLDIQTFFCTDKTSNYGNTTNTYEALVNNTTPQGKEYFSLTYNGTWYNFIIQGITELCVETVTYSCDSAPAGWYNEPGSSTNYYWDGSAWTQEDTCEGTYTINLVDNFNNGTVQLISSNTAYYADANTYEVSGDLGDSFSITHEIDANADYQIGSGDVAAAIATLSGLTNVGNITIHTQSTDSNLNANQFSISGTINGTGEYNVTLSGDATPIQYRYVLKVIGDETQDQGSGGDTLDADGNAQSPSGYLTVDGTTPSSGWTDVSSQFYANARQIEFTGAAGDVFNFALDVGASPTDYNLIIESSQVENPTPSNLSGVLSYTLDTTAPYTDGISGTITMPSGGGGNTIRILGQANQPEYRFTLDADENDTGWHIDGAPYQNVYFGYTGEEFQFTIQCDADADYTFGTITNTTKSGPNVASTNAVETTINNAEDTVTGTVTMPQGGGECNVHIDAGVIETRYNFTINIIDPYTDSASWPTINLNGTVGEQISITQALQNVDPDVTYSITGVTSNSPLVTGAQSGSTTDLDITLSSMPSGGGFATLTVSGNNTDTIYTYNTTFALTDPEGSVWDSTGTNANIVVTTTGVAGSVTPLSVELNSPQDNYFSGVQVTTPLANNMVFNSTQTYNLSAEDTIADIIASLTMPSGGGSGTITINPSVRQREYTYVLTLNTNNSNTFLQEIDTSNAITTGSLTATAVENNGTYVITYVGFANASINGILIGVQATNSVDYTPEIQNFTNSQAGYSAGIETNYGTANEGITVNFGMPSQHPSVPHVEAHTITANCSLVAKTLLYRMTYGDTIANVAPVSPLTINYYGTVGQEISWTKAYTASAGYNFNITGVSTTAPTTATVQPGGQGVQGTLTMPSGGGGGTVTASGTSNVTTFPFTILWQENINNTNWDNNSNTKQVVYNMQAGTTLNISETLVEDTNYQLEVLNGTTNNAAAVITQEVESTGLLSARLTMPTTGAAMSATITATGNANLITRTLTVTYEEFIPGASISNASTPAVNWTQDIFTGGIGTTVSNTYRYLTSGSGYQNPNITSLSDNGSPYISNLADSSGSGAGYDSFRFDYTIDSQNRSAVITVGGTVEGACGDCGTPFITKVNNASANASRGEIDVVLTDGCTVDTVTVTGPSPTTTNRVADPGSGGTNWSWSLLPSGEYTVLVTWINGCTYEDDIVITYPSTTAGPTYYYHTVRDCNDNSAPTHVARSSANNVSRNQLWNVGISQPGDPSVVNIVSANIGDQSSFDMMITNQTFECTDAGDGPEGFDP